MRRSIFGRMNQSESSVAPSNAARMADLRTLIANALEVGPVPDTYLNAFEFLWQTTPDSERENLAVEYKNIYEEIDRIRARQSRTTSANNSRPLIQNVPLIHREPGCGRTEGLR